MKSLSLLLVSYLSCSTLASPWFRRQEADVAPTVQIKNGTLAGVYSSTYNQDFFLGVPYAQPPLGSLRFRNPQSLNTTFNGTRSATAYSTECIGYGGDQIGYDQSEDCLYLNIVRPSGMEGQALPVAFWIHGGGYYMGGSPDRRYNLSFIVENSVKLGKPIMGVSINYRLSAYGFIMSNEVRGSGNTNIGLRDQRLALHWVNENIAAFGGDPKKVTIWGESAGASSVGFHLVAYNGRDDGLFRGAIMESGNPVSYNGINGTDYYQPLYNGVVQKANCSNAVDTLDCLRGVPFAQLNTILNDTTIASHWFPTLDGDFLQRYSSIQLKEGAYVHVPIIVGANSDEGTSFGPQGVNTTDDFIFFLTKSGKTAPGVNLPLPLAQQILEAYPDDPSVGIPASIPGRLPAPYGAQYKRAAAYFGDAVFIANRRLTCQTWAAANVSAYCYRFNAIPNGLGPYSGVTHFQEVAFAFLNVHGLGYAVDPFSNRTQSFYDLAGFMSASWTSFVYDQDPNSFRYGDPNTAQWPRYDLSWPMDMVFDANVTSHPEDDTYRAAGIQLINDWSVLFRR